MSFARKGFLGRNLVIGQKALPLVRGSGVIVHMTNKETSHPEKKGLERGPAWPQLEPRALAQTLSSDHAASLPGAKRGKGTHVF